MKDIKTFIEKAIEGGWRKDLENYKVFVRHVTIKEDVVVHDPDTSFGVTFLNVAEVLIDPLAWKAVGKVEGWSEVLEPFTGGINPTVRDYEQVAENNMHDMITALWEGRTIEEYIKTL